MQQIDSIIIGNQNISICQQTSLKMKMWGCEAARGTRDSDWSTSFDRFTLWNEDVRKIPMIFNRDPQKLLLIVASTFHNNTVEFPSNKIEQNEIFISLSSVHYLLIIQINIYICGHANLHKYFNRINI